MFLAIASFFHQDKMKFKEIDFYYKKCIIIPPAYKVYRGVYSFRLSVRLYKCSSVTFFVKVLHEVFFLLHIILKAYTLGC